MAPLRKDHVECLVKAAEILKENNVLFLIVGNTSLDREYANKVMEKTKEYESQIYRICAGDLKALYAACDIFILPSFGEGEK